MRLWILTVGEPLPIDPGNPRLLRSGIIAHLAASMGHDVTWWTSSLEHMNKRLRFDKTTTVPLASNLNIVCLHGGMYKKNISPARLLNHYRIGQAFKERAVEAARPDVILCSMPLIELAQQAIALGKKWNVPVILDVRDYWPDIWADALPFGFRSIGRVALSPWENVRNIALRAADSVIGITDEAVDWACKKSGRVKKQNDRGVPMAYRLNALSDADRVQADQFWQDQGLKTNDTILCFLGTLTGRFKDQFIDVVSAMRDLPTAKRQGLKIVMAGTGELLGYLRDQTKDLPEIIFPGWIDAPKITRLMELSAGGLLPYPSTQDFMDSLPNKSIEYLAGGLPIVTCLKGKVQNLIGRHDCGYVYEDGNVASLTDILSRMATDTVDFKRKGLNARSLYEREFHPDKVYGDLIKQMEAMTHD